ncbi:sigma-70 family RNA polymerase sigma factor [Clostridium saccharobutylicum]|uniref:RNA polymerase factor sigma-70 n=1 Tax=Clostridium saccharobutylicum DSM 13864 TaxID=1345695 RepID=U5MPV1_CLOSA|nr:sigma-70 family RNA polymerase sigma factor [Clostridium saccharobutylicum]AGX42538.1 RNA polymerase factor sigma-70 [Clostridium saccharobutylicum DSM 13864]AQR89824.1 RNA polymerase sigma factor SigX [Clostridium saccharobutylicum]AQR99726.1 RNA polymerase sigma factor SigX [Clostridium saccharobutylicum]AQS09456.1 RNA polymerase sigma factor SigX [Clostridium saccharobutylicum]AQS13712.1 RNA polymerase sigma factor SigX [Clostridium saccharobutylicum]
MKQKNFLKELRNHNPKALDYVFDTYGNLIFKVAYSVLNSRELSEECVNDSLLKIWNNIDSFKNDDNKFKGWIIILTKYTAIDMIRKESKHSNVTNLDFYNNEDIRFEDGLMQKETKEEILKEISKFDKDNKEIFIKRFFLDYSIKDISKSTGISENAISNRLRRCKLKLIESLKEEVL